MFRAALDRLSIGFSFVCALHCLVLPILLLALPTIPALIVSHENFHLFLMFLVLPASIFALFIGCKQHRDNVVAWTGTIGLVIISLTAMLSGYYHNELIEKGVTLVGSVLIGISHWLNMKHCRPHVCHTEYDC